jgi:hypothetical protein
MAVSMKRMLMVQNLGQSLHTKALHGEPGLYSMHTGVRLGRKDQMFQREF